jgi:hypothetical protein
MSFMGNIAKTVGGIVGKMNLPAGIGGILSQAVGKPMDQRQAFTSVLLATVAHVNEKPNFNLELEINDLWIHLSVLRNAQQSSGSGGLGGILSGVGNSVSGLANAIVKAQFNDGVLKSLTALLGSGK